MCSMDHLPDLKQTYLHIQSSTQTSSMQASNGYSSFMFIILGICNLKYYFDSANKKFMLKIRTSKEEKDQKKKKPATKMKLSSRN